MKFIVNQKPYSNEVEVKLARESKEKIFKITYWTTVYSATAILYWDNREAVNSTIKSITTFKK